MQPPQTQRPPTSPAQPAVSFGPVVLDRDAARRTETVVRYVEGQFRRRDPAGNSPVGQFFWLRKALTGSAIAAASASDTPGSGTVTLCDFNPGTGKWVSNGFTVTAYNPSTGGTVGASTYITIAWVSGIWEVVLEPC